MSRVVHVYSCHVVGDGSHVNVASFLLLWCMCVIEVVYSYDNVALLASQRCMCGRDGYTMAVLRSYFSVVCVCDRDGSYDNVALPAGRLK